MAEELTQAVFRTENQRRLDTISLLGGTRRSSSAGTFVTATLKDVAREAHVSMASVSRALNGTGVVTERIRTRVLEVAARLQYVPNVGAQSLMTRRTRIIGVLLPALHGEFFSELLRGIDLAARAR